MMLEDPSTAVAVHHHVHLARLRRSFCPICPVQTFVRKTQPPDLLLVISEVLEPDLLTDGLEGVDQKAASSAERIYDLVSDLQIDSIYDKLHDVPGSEVLSQPACKCIAEEVLERLALNVE